jgi:hypothetical protein
LQTFWPNLAQSSTKRHKTAQSGTFWPNLAQLGTFWHKTAQKSTKRHKRAQNGTKEHKAAQKSTKRHILAQSGTKWPKAAQSGPKCYTFVNEVHPEAMRKSVKKGTFWHKTAQRCGVGWWLRLRRGRLCVPCRLVVSGVRCRVLGSDARPTIWGHDLPKNLLWTFLFFFWATFRRNLDGRSHCWDGNSETSALTKADECQVPGSGQRHRQSHSPSQV